MQKGGISPSGKALRFALWRLPVGVTRYSWARNTAVMTEEGRRWLALAGFGFWVALFWWFASFLHDWLGMVVPLRVAGLFGLLLIWRIVGNLRRLWVHRRNLKGMAVSVQRQREMYQMQEQALDLLRKGARYAVPGGGVHTVRGLLSQPDPEYAAQRRQAQDQADQVRGMLPDEHRDMPLGDRFEPTFRLPRWLRRRGK